MAKIFKCLTNWAMAISVFFIPILAFADNPVVNPSTFLIGGGTTSDPNKFAFIDSFLLAAGRWIGLLTIIALGCVILFFFWGVAKYVRAGDNEEKRREGRNMMVYGVIAVFVVFCIWGLVAILARIFGVRMGGDAPTIGVPTVTD